MRRRRTLLALLLVGCVVGLTALLRRGGRDVRMSDGRYTALLGTTRGISNSIFPGGVFDHVVAAVVPAAGVDFGPLHLKPIKAVGLTYGGGPGVAGFSNSLTIWTATTRDPKGGQPTGGMPASNWPPFVSASLVGDDGEEWLARRGFGQLLANPGGTRDIVAWTFTSLPRRSPTLRLRLRTQRTNLTEAPLVELPFSNPWYQSYPTWSAPSRPVPVGDTHWNAALADCVTFDGPSPFGPPFDGPTSPQTRLEFLVLDEGQPTTGWDPLRVEAVDVTGNELMVSGMSTGRTNHLVYASLHGSTLSPSEVWKVRVRFTKMNPAPKPDWVSPEVDVTANGHLPDYRFVTNLFGSTLTLATSQSPFPEVLQLKLDPLPTNRVVRILGVADAQGNAGTYQSGFFSDDGFEVHYDLPPRPVRVSLQLVETRTVEFLVRPRRGDALAPASPR